MNTIESEYKVLDVDPEAIARVMRTLGSKKVYDGIRIITYLDYANRFLRNAGESIKLTEENKLKLEHIRKAANGLSDTVKLFVSCKDEAAEFLSRLGLIPITQVKARRISYELGGIDLDIDCFPGIPSFMEIDLADSGTELKELLKKLGLVSNEVMIATTPEVFTYYGKDYFAEFAIP